VVADFVACKVVFKNLCESTVLVLVYFNKVDVSLLTPELNPSVQHCLTRFFTGDFAS
jgi:hypothetical protein